MKVCVLVEFSDQEEFDFNTQYLEIGFKIDNI